MISRLNKEFNPNFPENDLSHHIFLFKKILGFIHRTSCFKNVERVVVGLSGGVDSAVLLHLLKEYQNSHSGPEVYALHIHHKQRGHESDRDQAIAKKISLQTDCPFDVVTLDDVSMGASEDELRVLRYQALESYAEKNKITRIALGHHMDDQAETFLFRLVRGADVHGLAGMKSVRLPFIRPLLDCSRIDIEMEAERCQIPYVHDSSNFSNGPSRNYVRNVILPALKSKLDPQVSKHLLDVSHSLAELDEWFSLQAIEMIKNVEVSSNVYSVRKLQEVPSVLRKKMLHTMFSYISKDKQALSREHVEMINGWVENTQSPKYLEVFSTFRVEKDQGVIRFVDKSVKQNSLQIGS